MTSGDAPEHGLQIQSTLAADGRVLLDLAQAAVAPPGPSEVVIRVEASPINPSDVMPLLAGADPATAQESGADERGQTTLSLPPQAAAAQAGRHGVALPIGLNAAGRVIAAGRDAGALLGRNVTTMSMRAGGFGEYVTVDAAECAALPDGVAPRDAADAFCNPMTALTMIEAMRLEGCAALINTAAASNLGQMLVRICAEDGVPLVSVVRRREQADLLKAMGAEHVCDSSAPDFADSLRAAIAATGATIAFDAIGGGETPGMLLEAIERVEVARGGPAIYGSLTFKQVFTYGHLDPSPIVLHPARYGMLWSVRRWAMPQTLAQLSPERIAALRARVIDGITTTFASPFAHEISLRGALDPATIAAYARMATGEKFLLNPTL